MKLAALGIIVPEITPILFTGDFELTSVKSSDGEPYYVGKLLSPITVRCSVDSEIEPLREVEELHIRESALGREDWMGDKVNGLYIKGWVADFSKGQEMAIYQDMTIREWSKTTRKGRQEERREGLNARIKARQADLAKKPEVVATDSGKIRK